MTETRREGPLAGIRVLDLTQALSGPFATMILGDLGATVVKVESPRGDLTRNTPPYFIEGVSLYFLANNRNKRSIVIDLKNAEGRKVLMELVRHSDIVISNFRPGALSRLGIDHVRLEQVNSRIISCNISGYGSRGPRSAERAVDLVIQAAAAAMSITGFDDQPPARAGVPTADLSSGLFAAIGVLSALQERTRTGRGCQVETSLFHSQLTLLNYVAANAVLSQHSPSRMGSGHPGTVPSQVFRTATGWIAVDAGFDAHFQEFCEVLGIPELATDPEFHDRPGRSANRARLLPLIDSVLVTRSTEEWLGLLSERSIPCAPVNDVLAAVNDIQAKEYETLKTVHFGTTDVEVLSTPLWFDGDATHSLSAPPRLGEHTRMVLSELTDYSEEEISALEEIGAIRTARTE